MEINTGDARRRRRRRCRRRGPSCTAAAQKIKSAGGPGGAPICLSPDWARMLPFIFQNNGSLANVQSPAVVAAVNYYVGLLKSGLAADADTARRRLVR